jgi:hypothetical protein
VAAVTEEETRVAEPTVHDQAAAALLDPYLDADPPDGWHLIDNADADDVRHALEVAIQRIRATLKTCEQAEYVTTPDGAFEMIRADSTTTTLRGPTPRPARDRDRWASGESITFRVDDLLCPRCGYARIIGFLYLDQAGCHQHTHYVCTFWRAATEDMVAVPGATTPCGWHGWTVPSA